MQFAPEKHDLIASMSNPVEAGYIGPIAHLFSTAIPFVWIPPETSFFPPTQHLFSCLTLHVLSRLDRGSFLALLSSFQSMSRPKKA